MPRTDRVSRQQKEQCVSRICVVYHSGYGHTKVQADAVAEGARSVPDTEVYQFPSSKLMPIGNSCMRRMR